MEHDLLKSIELLRQDIESFKRDIVRDITKMEASLARLEEQYNREVIPNLKTWNTTSDNVSKVVWLVVGTVITALLGVVLLK